MRQVFIPSVDGGDSFKTRPQRSRFAYAVIAVIALAVVAAFGSGVFPWTGTASAAGKAVPFKGVMENTETSVGFEFPNLTLNIEGVVTATHIGKGSASGTLTIDVSAFGPGGCTELVAGSIAFTAADGSVLDMAMTNNRACMDANGVITAEGQYEVVGGTKRFGEAAGTIDFVTESLVTIVPGAVSESVSSLSGRISRP